MRSLLILAVLAVSTASAAEYHVAGTGSDQNDGSAAKPFKTISAAARAAQPGDAITVHAGTYRERVTPPRGGESDTRRIVYQAAEGEKVEIKGSEVVTGWAKVAEGVWKVTLPNAFFGAYNPYQDVIEGDWFTDRGRRHHTGEVYLNGQSLWESATLEGVMKPRPAPIPLGLSAKSVRVPPADPVAAARTWFCESDAAATTLYANFGDRDPNKELIEINVRESCFYPDRPGRNYITVRGFRMSQAATQWAAPTAEQIGLLGTHWSKGWIIEQNVISDSKCTGITLGKDRKSGHNVWSKDPSKDGALHYNEVIQRVLADGWSKETIGSHVVRNNTIFNCEQAGICGSMGAVFSRITNNHIYNIWTKRQFAGAEIGGIKIHGAIDTLIAHNRLHNVGRGLWMDWMTQGTRITGNLCYNNTTDDLYVEVSHGPYLVDNNIFLSDLAIKDWSQGGAYAHNLIAGKVVRSPQGRTTPHHKAHSTAVVALKNITGGDNRFYNNIFVGGAIALPDPGKVVKGARTGYGLAIYDAAELPMAAAGNVYLKGAKPWAKEKGFVEQAALDPKIEVVEEGDRVSLHITFDKSFEAAARPLVTTQLLGKAATADLPFENPDGSPLTVDTDYFGKKRSATSPSAGPFENPGSGRVTLKVW